MTSLLRRALGRESRYSLTNWNDDMMFQFQNATYPILGGGMSSAAEERIEEGFEGAVRGAYASNGVVFATILARMLLFTEARFQYQQMRNGKPGDLFGTRELSILERPWPNGTTRELLARMEQDVSLAGNAFILRDGRRLRRLRPDWVTIVLDAPGDDPFANVAGYLYQPGGRAGNRDAKLFAVNEIAHWSPIPDPLAHYRGMSWISPVLPDVLSDKQATEHKRRFLANAATPTLAVILNETVKREEFEKFVAKMEQNHAGTTNVGKTMYLGGGADVRPLSVDFKNLELRSTQGAIETRITAAGGVPAVIVGLSEGLQAATYSNYGQARRKFGDHWARPQWGSVAAALETIVGTPADARLWYDERHIAFLREDEKDAAEIQKVNAETMNTWITAGFDPASVVKAMLNDDITELKHTGMVSVQLQKPGTPAPAAAGRDAALENRSAPQPVHVTVPVNVERGETPAVVVNVPEQIPPHVDVHVEPTPVTVEARVDAPDVTVNVEPTPVQVNVEPTPVEVRNEVDVDVPPAQVVVNTPRVTRTETTVERNRKGEVTGSTAVTETVEE